MGAWNQSEQECSGHTSTLQTAADIYTRGNSDTRETQPQRDSSACRTLHTRLQAVNRELLAPGNLPCLGIQGCVPSEGFTAPPELCGSLERAELSSGDASRRRNFSHLLFVKPNTATLVLFPPPHHNIPSSSKQGTEKSQCLRCSQAPASSTAGENNKASTSSLHQHGQLNGFT